MNHKETSAKMKLAMTFNTGKKHQNGSQKNIYMSSKKKELTQIVKPKRDSEIFSSHALNQIKRRADIGYLEHKKLQRESFRKMDVDVLLSSKNTKKKDSKLFLSKKLKNQSKIENNAYSDSIDTFFKVFNKKTNILNNNKKKKGMALQENMTKKKNYSKPKLQKSNKNNDRIQNILLACNDIKEPYLLKQKNYSNKELQNSEYDTLDCIYEPNVYKSQPQGINQKNEKHFQKVHEEYIKIYKQDSLNVSSGYDSQNKSLKKSPSSETPKQNINESYNFQQLYQQSSNIYSDNEDSDKSENQSNTNLQQKNKSSSKTKTEPSKIQKSETLKSDIMNKQNFSRLKQVGRKSQTGIPLKMSDVKSKRTGKGYVLERNHKQMVKHSSRSNDF